MRRIFPILLFALLSVVAFAQTENEGFVPFNGEIVDLARKPIRSVKVYSIDPHYCTFTDRKGRFGLSNVLPGDTVHLVYKKANYVIPVEGRKSMRIVLGDQLQVEEDEDLENFGYGFVPRRESCSSSAGISGELLRRTGCTNILDALQGLVNGLHISVDAMGNKAVDIRNTGTYAPPLYIVDGVEVGTLDYLSIYDVESVEVMKDAYIYGTRGMNGAILVTLKK